MLIVKKCRKKQWVKLHKLVFQNQVTQVDRSQHMKVVWIPQHLLKNHWMAQIWLWLGVQIKNNNKESLKIIMEIIMYAWIMVLRRMMFFCHHYQMIFHWRMEKMEIFTFMLIVQQYHKLTWMILQLLAIKPQDIQTVQLQLMKVVGTQIVLVL